MSTYLVIVSTIHHYVMYKGEMKKRGESRFCKLDSNCRPRKRRELSGHNFKI